MKPLRNSKGEFRTKGNITLGIFLGLLLLAITAIALGNKPITFVEGLMGSKTEAYQAEVDTRDSVTKLTENLEAKMRQLQDVRDTLNRANKAQESAAELYDSVLEEYNTAIQSLNLFMEGT